MTEQITNINELKINKSENESNSVSDSSDSDSSVLDSNNSDSNNSDSSDSESNQLDSCDSDESETLSDSSECVDKTKGYNYMGMILNKKYVIIEKIGYGTFSTVWLAYLLNQKKFYAIKIQHPEDYDDGIKEVKNLESIKKLKCVNCIYIHEWFKYQLKDKKDPSICMVFDLMAGSTYQFIKKGIYENGLDEKIVAQIIKQIAQSLKSIKLKMKACHTDIKPENILIKGVNNNIELFINKFLEEDFDSIYNLLFKKNSKLINDECIKIITDINKKINKYITDNFNSSEKLKEIDPNLNVVLADFATLKYFNKIEHNDEIQTRYYRAPENILMCKYDYKVDIWSLACSAYELLTGEILFEPEKDKNYSTDFHHIFWIIQIIGNIPYSLINRSKNANEFFRSNGKFRQKNPESYSLKDIFNDKNKNVSDKMITLLSNMLIIEPNKRYDYDDIIHYINTNY